MQAGTISKPTEAATSVRPTCRLMAPIECEAANLPAASSYGDIDLARRLPDADASRPLCLYQ